MKLLYKLFLDAPIQWFLDYLMGGVKHQVQHRFIELRNWVD